LKISSHKKLGIIVIAAGNSSRLGQPKQLVEIAGINLLQKTVNIAQRLSKTSVCVLGYNADRFEMKLHLADCKILVNKNWPQGMGSSIACATKFFEKKVNAVMILLCDQYRLTKVDYDQLVEQWQTKPDKIIASQYFDKKTKMVIEGAPAIFPKRYFAALMTLKEKGARDILRKNQEQIMTVLLENAAFDLDTEDDLKILSSVYI